MTSLQDALDSCRRQTALQQRARLLDAVWADAQGAPGPPLPHHYAVDLVEAPDGVWRVARDHVGDHPGALLLEAPVLAVFLPALCRRLLRETLLLPSMPVWWLGDRATLAMIEAAPARYSLRCAFDPAGVPIPLAGLVPAARRRLQDAVNDAPQRFVVGLNLKLSHRRLELGSVSQFGDARSCSNLRLPTDLNELFSDSGV